MPAGLTEAAAQVFMYCAPTRSSIMSGRTPFRVNQILFGMNEPDWDMPSEMTAMPRKMKLGGYATHMVGKVRAPHSSGLCGVLCALSARSLPAVARGHAELRLYPGRARLRHEHGLHGRS